jgi:DNA ligase-1
MAASPIFSKVKPGLYKTQTLYKHTKNGVRRYELFVGFFNKRGNDGINYDGPFADIDIKDINKDPSVITTSYRGELWTEYGYMKANSKLTRTAMTSFITGKNVGKKNETSSLQQAINDGTSKYNKKIQEGMTTTLPKDTDKTLDDDKPTIANTSTNYFLMAAHNFRTVDASKLKYPCIGQVKMDGLRAGARYYNNSVIMYSRARIEYTVKDNIRKELEVIFKEVPDWFLDGEFYIHGVPLQTMVSLVKNPDKGNELEYHIFDCFSDLTRPLMLRVSEDLLRISKIINKHGLKYIKVIESVSLNNKEEVEAYCKDALKHNYEGVMLKNMDGKYEASLKREIRSYDILKYKPDFDSEFKIIGFKDGAGKEKGAIIFILETSGNKEFSARPKDISVEERKKLYEKAIKYPDLFKGKMATIQYDALSVDGVPQRLRFKMIRDYPWDYFLNYEKQNI